MSASTDASRTRLAITRAVSVSDRDELVVLCISDFERSMTFDTALRLSAAMMVEARVCRRIERGNGFGFVAGALLTLEAERPQRTRFGNKLPAMLKAQDIHVQAAGREVLVRFGRTTAGIDWRDAVQISLWLRLHGKKARNFAGERGHWRKIGGLVEGDHSLH